MDSAKQSLTRHAHAGVYEDLAALRERVRDALHDMERIDLMEAYGGGNEGSQRDLDDLGKYLAHTLMTLAVRLQVYADAFGLTGTAQLVADWLRRWPPSELEKTGFWVTPETDGRESIPYNELARIVEAIIVLAAPEKAPQPEPNEKNDRHRLEYCLRSLAKICRERGQEPHNELEVQAVLHSHLEGVFPDYTRTVTISKPLVSFKADGGVISLKSAIECKFVASKEEVGVAMHGLTEDLSGYSGSDDWKHFYSVVFMTEAFATEGQMERALGLSNNAGSWKTILVTGAGSRVRRQKVALAKPSTASP